MSLVFFHGEYLVGWISLGALALITALGTFIVWFSRPPRNPALPTAIYLMLALVGFAMWISGSPNVLISSLAFALTLPWSGFYLFDIQIPSLGILLGIVLNTAVLYFVAKSMHSYRVVAQFSEVQLQELARLWLRDVRDNVDESDSGEAVVEMNFLAPPEVQWRFILIAVSLSESDDELGHIAAGPIEHLLGWHGERYIDVVENEVKSNPKFARALTDVWRYMMTDEVWSRVQRLQQGISPTIPENDR
ncbi:MAG TPA: hypothetical protein VJS64_06485 [Pyrinomonadaceae bacterium]|nr:hypothetical protein [Pyrinomonadaceae bacterium]